MGISKLQMLFKESADMCIVTSIWDGVVEFKPNKNRGAVVTALEKKRGYLHCLRNVTLLPFIKYTKKGVSDYILCIARV